MFDYLKYLRLKFGLEFAKYILGREKIVETSYMIDLGQLEETFHSSLIIQFSFICFFSPFLLSAGLLSYIINILVIIMTVRMYSNYSQRPISRRTTNMGIWVTLYNLIGYLGLLYNTIMIVKLNDGITAFKRENWFKPNNRTFTTRVNESRYDAEFIYRFFFSLSIFKLLLQFWITLLPTKIKKRILREKLIKNRVNKENSMMLKRAGEQQRKSLAGGSDKMKEGERKKKAGLYLDKDKLAMRYFFNNKNDIMQIDTSLKSKGVEMLKDFSVRLVKSKTDLL